MFGFGKRKSSDPPKSTERARRSAESRERKSQNVAQLGFMTGIGNDDDIDNLMGNMDVDDDDLEDELAMLLEGNQPAIRRPKPKPSPSKRSPAYGNQNSSREGKTLSIDDEQNDDLDEDIDDPDLEAELGDILGVPSAAAINPPTEVIDDEESPEEAPPQTITGDELIHLLKERLELYEKAKAAADSMGDSAKSRRFTRGLKTLKDLIVKAKAGRAVAEADIPPAVSIGIIKKDNSQPQQPPPGPVDLPVSPPSVPKVPPRPRLEEPTTLNLVSVDSDNTNAGPLPEPLVPLPVLPSQPDPKSNTSAEEPTNIPVMPVLPVLHVLTFDPATEERLKEYKVVAVALKRQGDVQGALKYLKLSKSLETAMKNGETIDLANYPSAEAILRNQSKESDTTGSSVTPIVAPEVITSPVTTATEDRPSETGATTSSQSAPTDDIFGAPPPPKTILEALEQRLQKYKSEVEKATAASNSSKARRMGRIVKQFEEAIVLHKKGKPVPYDELPTPPGFAPIPVGGPPVQPVPQQKPAEVPGPSSSVEPSSAVSPEKKSKDDSPKPEVSGSSPSGSTGASVSRSGKPATKLTLQEKQLKMIILRQQQFKEAALNAKKRGDINQAREFLRTAKGFDKLIQVAQAGLPVDMATLPAPPEAVAKLELEEADNFEVVSASDCIMPTGNAAEIYSKLEEDLKQQLKMCMRTREHFKNIGDIASANRFESMALESKRDLDALRLAMKKGGDIPKYHYENRIFSITECNTDIGDDEIEISIMRGINYKVTNPSDVDTYVKIELPYPSAEELQTNKTHVVKDTNNPDYNATYKMSINRTARNFQRFVHRHGFKCEVWSKGGLCSGGFFFCACHRGFLRGSTLIGTATVKLLPLETKCTLHDAFDVCEGRKVVGKLEVRVKVREPVLTKQITQKKEKWLSIDRA